MDLAGLTFSIIKDQLPGWTEERFKEAAKPFDFDPVFVGGEVVGAIMHRGPEIHVAVIPSARRRWFNKSILAFIAEKIERYGGVVTQVEDGHELGHWFARRLGFEPFGDPPKGFTYYRRLK